MWKCARAGIADGERFEIDGLNVWDYQWEKIPGITAKINDPHYGQSYEFEAYQISSGATVVQFAAGEFSNCIWGFYVPSKKLTFPSERSVVESRITTYDKFWHFYIREHAQPLNRQLHFIGSSLGLVCLTLLFYTGNLLFFPLGLVAGYGFAWIGHFFVEKNKPASFNYPLWSFRSDWKMWVLMLLGRMGPEIERARKIT